MAATLPIPDQPVRPDPPGLPVPPRPGPSQALTSSSSAAASPAWAPPTSCTRADVSFALLERTSRPGGVILSEEVDGYTIDAGPDALLVQKPEGIALCQELGLGDRLVPTKPPRLAFIQRGGRLHPLPAARCLAFRRGSVRSSAPGSFTWAGKLRMAAELFVPPRSDDADESIGAFMRAAVRRRGDDLPGRTAARRHSRRRRRPAVDPRAVSPLRRGRTRARQPACARSAAIAPAEDVVRRRVPIAARRIERVGARARRDAAAACTPVRHGRSGASPLDPPRVGDRRRQSRSTAARVIVATPAYVTADLVRDVGRRTSRGCAARFRMRRPPRWRWRSRATAVAHPLNGSGFVVPRTERTGILAASWLSSKWPHRAPAGSRADAHLRRRRARSARARPVGRRARRRSRCGLAARCSGSPAIRC